jgi:hypothetical protein
MNPIYIQSGSLAVGGPAVGNQRVSIGYFPFLVFLMIIPIIVITFMFLNGIIGLGLLLSPNKTLPIIARFGLAGWYYQRARGSAIPTWRWRLMGFGLLSLAVLYLPALVNSLLKKMS